MRIRAGFLVLLMACGGSPGGEDPPEAGGEAPPQADRPLVGPEAISVAERFRLAGDLRLELPRDLDIDAQGNLYILDFAPPTQLLKYDATGQFLRRFADRDEDGGNRLVSAIEFALAPWNTVLVVDRGRNSLQTFLATTGTFASSVEVQPAVALDVHALPEFGEFYLKKWVPEQRRAAVLRMRAPYDSLATTYEVRLPPGLSVREEARGVHFHTTTDREGRLYVAFWDGYPVRILAPDGRTLRTVDLARQAVFKTPAEIAREADENLAILREQTPDVDEALLREAAQPDSIRPLIEELAVDPVSRLWVRTNRADAAGVSTYDVFNEAGDYLARVDIPGIVERTAFDPQGRLYVIAAATPGGRRDIIGYDVLLGETTAP